jgi:HEAT repeat protein
LRATEDSLFTPETCATANRPVAWHALLEQIERGSNSARVAGLWELVQRPRNAREDLGEAVRMVRKLLHHRLPIVRAEAATALGLLGEAAEPAVDDLLQLLDDTSDDVRSAAAHALGRLGMRPEEVVPSLAELLDDRSQVQPAALAIAAFGPAARVVVPRLKSALVSALMEVEYSNVDCLVHAIEAVALDPPHELRHVLAACDAESRLQAEHMLAARHPISTFAPTPGALFEH